MDLFLAVSHEIKVTLIHKLDAYSLLFQVHADSKMLKKLALLDKVKHKHALMLKTFCGGVD